MYIKPTSHFYSILGDMYHYIFIPNILAWPLTSINEFLMLKLIENTKKSQRESYLYKFTTIVLIRQIYG